MRTCDTELRFRQCLFGITGRHDVPGDADAKMKVKMDKLERSSPWNTPSVFMQNYLWHFEVLGVVSDGRQRLKSLREFMNMPGRWWWIDDKVIGECYCIRIGKKWKQEARGRALHGSDAEHVHVYKSSKYSFFFFFFLKPD